MKCPVCKDVDLAMMDKQGISIDYCPQCRGVWLDRGELEKLIELSGNSTGYVPQQKQQEFNNKHNDHDNRHYNNDSRGYNDGHNDYNHKKKKESIWGEIFDF